MIYPNISVWFNLSRLEYILCMDCILYTA